MLDDELKIKKPLQQLLERLVNMFYWYYAKETLLKATTVASPLLAT